MYYWRGDWLTYVWIGWHEGLSLGAYIVAVIIVLKQVIQIARSSLRSDRQIQETSLPIKSERLKSAIRAILDSSTIASPVQTISISILIGIAILSYVALESNPKAISASTAIEDVREKRQSQLRQLKATYTSNRDAYHNEERHDSPIALLEEIVELQTVSLSGPEKRWVQELVTEYKRAGRDEEAKQLLIECVQIEGAFRLMSQWFGRDKLGYWELYRDYVGKLSDRATDWFQGSPLRAGSVSAALMTLGEFLVDQGEFSEAEAAYRRAIQTYPKSTTAYNGLGVALLGQGQIEDAVVAFRKAVDYAQSSAEFDSATANFRKATELASGEVPSN